MGCGLTQDERDVLHYLVKGRCGSEKHSINIKAIERDLGENIQDLEDLLDGLVLKRYAGCKKKKTKYYYSNPGPCIKVLAMHGVVTWRGGRGPL
jgi:hypothetical protein